MDEERSLVQAALHTDQGQVRRVNQDFVAAREPAGAAAEHQDGWLYVLADGAGGMDAGEVASQYATERFLHHYFDAAETAWKERIETALVGANYDLRALGAQRDGGSRMATTMVVTVIHDGEAEIANVGDSRAYHWRNKVLRQITKDQSLVAQLVEEGAITAEEAESHPRKHVLLYSIGSDRKPKVDLYHLPLQKDDILLMCSDGLTRHVSDPEISSLLSTEPDPDEAAQQLIALANERGGQDNISVVVLRYTPAAEALATAIGGPTAVSPTVVTGTRTAAASARSALWLYTAFLCVVQTLLIFLVWSFLTI
jgi:protein phosphatase